MSKLVRKPSLSAATLHDDAHEATAPPSLENTLNSKQIEQQLLRENENVKDEEGKAVMKKDEKEKDVTKSAATSSTTRQQRPASSSIILSNSFSLPVISYITSTSIFVPEISLVNSGGGGNSSSAAITTLASSSTLLNQLPSEDVPDLSLAKIVGATSAAGCGLMVHIFKCGGGNTTNFTPSGSMPSSSMMMSSSFNTPKMKPFLLALLDEEEASNRPLTGIAAGSVGGVPPEKLEKRIASIRTYVKNIRFLPDEYERFTQLHHQYLMVHSGSSSTPSTSATPTPTNAREHQQQQNTEFMMIHQMVESFDEKHLAAVAGVMLPKLPKLRIQKYEEGSSYIKVLVR